MPFHSGFSPFFFPALSGGNSFRGGAWDRSPGPAGGLQKGGRAAPQGSGGGVGWGLSWFDSGCTTEPKSMSTRCDAFLFLSLFSRFDFPFFAEFGLAVPSTSVSFGQGVVGQAADGSHFPKNGNPFLGVRRHRMRRSFGRTSSRAAPRQGPRGGFGLGFGHLA